MSALTQSTLAESYADLEWVVRDCVHRFRKSYGGDFEELMAEASLLFVRAYYRHDEEQASFKTWVRYFISIQLLEQVRSKARKNKIIRQTELVEGMALHEDQNFDLDDFLHGLSDDAVHVVRLALASPSEVWKVAREKGGNPINFRTAIKDFLLGFGWSTRRITESFSEIRRAME